MDTILKNKTAIVALALLLIAFYVLSLVFGGAVPTESESAEEKNAALVEIAGELSTIEFNQEIFSSRAYRQLIDFSTALPAEAPGRSNPFGVIGR